VLDETGAVVESIPKEDEDIVLPIGIDGVSVSLSLLSDLVEVRRLEPVTLDSNITDRFLSYSTIWKVRA
jgi:hypothetical protein